MKNIINTKELENEIIEITKGMLFHHGEPFASSLKIAKSFGKPHDDLLKKIRTFKSFDELISLGKISERKYKNRGKEYPYFELDAEAYTFTCLSMGGRKAEQFKWAIIEAFKRATAESIAAKVAINVNLTHLAWQNERRNGKDTRKNLGKKIEELCKYAECMRDEEYPKECPYYMNITKTIYSFLGLKKPPKGTSPRDVFNPYELEAIKEAEAIAIDVIDFIMQNEMDYHKVLSKLKSELHTQLNCEVV